MKLHANDAIKTRLNELLITGTSIYDNLSLGKRIDFHDAHVAKSFLAGATHIIKTICPPQSHYDAEAAVIIDRSLLDPLDFVLAACDMLALLKSFSRDVDLGLIGRLEDQISAVAFDDFLDHADEYHLRGKHKEAGVLAGVVFEDTIKRIAKKNGAPDLTKAIDQLISFLGSKGLFRATLQKRARTAADVRTRSTHADWDAYTLDDVKECITVTRELITSHLDS